MKIEKIAEDVWRIPLMQPDLVNVYILEDVLIDSGGRFAHRKLLPLLSDRTLSGHALTHGHFDHQGSSHTVCQHLQVPLFCGAGDRQAVESGDLVALMPDPGVLLTFISRSLAGPGHPVSAPLSEGDLIGGFTVIETPGHTPGHVAFWREEDGILILGDVLFHRNPVTFRRGLSEPFVFATFDPKANRDSARKLAALEPKVVCFGHGAPLAHGEQFTRFVEGLPRA